MMRSGAGRAAGSFLAADAHGHKTMPCLVLIVLLGELTSFACFG
jgi:hypothetical protein